MSLRSKDILLVTFIIICGIFLRYLHLAKTAYFNADQENFAWTAVKIIQQHQPTLIGIKAGEFPVFIGPLMYYVYALIYALFSWSPLGLSYFHLLVSVFTLISVFFVAHRLLGRTTGFLALLIYNFSFFFIDWDRRVWLPTFLISTSVWVLYALVNRRWYILGLLLSLAFQLHLTGLIFWPLVVAGRLVHRKSRSLTPFLKGLSLGLIGFIPIVIFDLRHHWLNAHGWLSLLHPGNPGTNLFGRISFLANLTAGNALGILSLTSTPFARILLIAAFIIWSFIIFKSHSKTYLIHRLLWLWLVIPILVFLLVNVATPEYYFALTFPTLLLLLASIFAKIVVTKSGKMITLTSLILLFVFNLHQLLTEELENITSLYHKQRLVNYIIQTAPKSNFFVNYLTAPGLNYGFDYLFYQQLHHVPSQAHPDFTIVVPWNYDQLPISEKFGGLGVINHSD